MKSYTQLTRNLLLLAVFSSAGSHDLNAQQRRVNTVSPEVSDLRITSTQPVVLEAFHSADMGSRVSGVVEEVRVDIGQKVQRGDILATLAVPDLEAKRNAMVAEEKVAQTHVASQEALFQAMEAETKRILDLVEKGSITEKIGEEAKKKLASAEADFLAATANLEATAARLAEIQAQIGFATLRAPFDGYVTVREVDPGDLVKADSFGPQGLPLLRVVQTEKLRAVIFVPEKDTTLLDVGDPLTLRFDALPGVRFESKISRMSMALDTKTQRMRVEADIETGDTKLRAGFYGSAEIVLEEKKDAKTLPATALRFNGEIPLVYLVNNGKISHRPIEIGMNHGAWVEVVSGIQGNETVVVGTVDRLPEGTSVSVR